MIDDATEDAKSRLRDHNREMRIGQSPCIKVYNAYLPLQALVIEHKATFVIIHDRVSGRPGTGPSYYSVRIRENDGRCGTELCM